MFHKNYYYPIFFAIFSIAFLSFIFHLLNAQSSGLRINEIYPNPPGDEKIGEFIELYNASDEEIDLENYSISDASKTFAFTKDDFPDLVVQPQGFFVIDRSISGIAINNSGAESITLKDSAGNTVDSYSWSENAGENESIALDSKGKFRWTTTVTRGEENIITEPNRKPVAKITILSDHEKIEVGEKIKFSAKDSFDPNGDILSYLWQIEDKDYKKETIEHEFSETGEVDVKLTVTDPQGLSDTEKITVDVGHKDQNLKDLYITEIFPNPKGSDNDDEFIEIWNKSQSKTIDLSGLYLDDEKGGSRPYRILAGTKIKPKKYTAFYRSDTGLAFNNDRDEGRILDYDEKEVRSVEYDNVKEDYSYSRFKDDDIFEWSSKTTPNEENKIVLAKEDDSANATSDSEEGMYEKIVIQGVRSAELGANFELEGFALVEPGVLSEKYFYIQDKSTGIQIYNYDEEFPEILLGQKIQVQGELASYNDELRIKVESIDQIHVFDEKAEVKPTEAKTGEIAETREGTLVKIAGTITKSSGSNIYIDDGSGEIRIYIYESTGIEKPRTKKGDGVEIIGIVSETKSGYRILPRYQDDFRLLDAQGNVLISKTTKSASGNLPEAGTDLVNYFIIVGGLLIVLTINRKQILGQK